MREIDKKAVEAAENPAELDGFVAEYESFILKCASKASKRYITKSDDEWSVAMEAFCNAVFSYSYDKGSFLAFAELLIRRRLIDYFRLEKRRLAEFPVDPTAFTGETEDGGGDAPLSAEITAKTMHTPENALKDEIEAVSALLDGYGFSFYDLAACSPKSKKTRAACRQAVEFMISSSLLCAEMRRTKALPLKILEKNTNIPRKVLERHRKYIIAATEILIGEYPGLAFYMKSMKEGDT